MMPQTAMFFFRFIYILVFLCAASQVCAQEKGTIKATVNKNTILIGEPLLLRVEADLSTEEIKSYNAVDSIPHFEMLVPVSDTVKTGNGRSSIVSWYTITSFDSGHWVIPSFRISNAVKSDTIGIDVVFSEFNPEQEYHDIKDIIEVKPEKKQSWWWYAAGGALLLGLLLVYLLRKKKPVPVAIQQTAVNPYDEAIEQLGKLEKNKPDSKHYHTRLADIFRLYIFRKKGILSLQKTTDDLMLQLKELSMDKDQYDKLSQSLRLGDFVKFAKYISADEDDMDCLNAIRNTIISLEKSEAKVSP